MITFNQRLTMEGLVLAALICLSVESLTEGEHYVAILGGLEVEGYNNPYQASLQRYVNGDWHHFCGAVLIAPDKLVTAGHCLTEGFTTRIKIGAINLEIENEFSQDWAVSKTIIHPRYKQPGERNDIGVVYLETPVTFNANVQVVHMAPKGSNFEGTRCKIIGWGKSEEYQEGSPYLREAFLNAISAERCNEFVWDKPITDKEICVFDEKRDSNYRARSCQGDSGGALMCGVNYRYLAGVTSAGGQGCTGTKPSIYTRVSEYREWIDSV